MSEKVEKTAEEIAAEKVVTDAANLKATRDGIKVTVSRATNEETDEEKATREAAEASAKTEVKEGNEKEVEAKKEEIEENIEDLEAKKDEAKTTAEKDKFQKRIDREVAKRKALETEIKELKAKLAAEPDKENALTEEEVERRSEEKAAQKQLVREFKAANDRLFKAGVKADKDFQAKINALADDIGLIPSHLVGILDDLDNGGEVLVHFTNNPDEAEEIYALSPAKAAVKLAKISAKIEADKKPAPKPISKVPDPTEPIKGGSQSPEQLPANPTKEMEKFVRLRAQQVEQRRKARMGLH